jgi:DNA transformation protein
MASSGEFRDLIAERLAALGAIAIRRMFGGAGVYCGDTMFGLVDDDVLYLRVDEGNRDAFLAAGSQPFTYARGGERRIALSYYRAPDHLLDDDAELLAWAKRALAAALRVKIGAKKGGKPKARPTARRRAAGTRRASRAKHVVKGGKAARAH